MQVRAVGLVGGSFEEQPQQQLQGAAHPTQLMGEPGQARQIPADGIRLIELYRSHWIGAVLCRCRVKVRGGLADRPDAKACS